MKSNAAARKICFYFQFWIHTNNIYTFETYIYFPMKTMQYFYIKLMHFFILKMSNFKIMKKYCEFNTTRWWIYYIASNIVTIKRSNSCREYNFLFSSCGYYKFYSTSFSFNIYIYIVITFKFGEQDERRFVYYAQLCIMWDFCYFTRCCNKYYAHDVQVECMIMLHSHYNMYGTQYSVLLASTYI